MNESSKPYLKQYRQKDFGIRDIYKFYLKNCKRNPLSYSDYCMFFYGHTTANKTTNQGLISDIKYEMINRAYILQMPGLGFLGIKKKKPKMMLDENGNVDYMKSKLVIDFKSTKKYWENNPGSKERKVKIFYKNEHTRGYRIKVVWDKYSAKIKNKSAYRFKPVRGFNREIAKAVKTNRAIDFYE